MSLNSIDATLRTQGGKGPARRLRADGKIPAVAYGKAMEATPLAVSPKVLSKILGGERGLNTVVHLNIAGVSDPVPTLVADYQVHPVTRSLLHADFKQINLDDLVEVKVALELSGRSKGVVMGGKLNQVHRRVPLRCKPMDVPVKLTYDITDIGLDELLTVKMIAVPDGVEILLPADQTLAGVYSSKHRKEEDADAAEDGAAQESK